jgi:hypothetical protein
MLQTFDAFGVDMTKPLRPTRSFTWRGKGNVGDCKADRAKTFGSTWRPDQNRS